MLYVRFPILLRNVADLLYERGVELSYDQFDTGGIALALNLQTQSKSEGQGECCSVNGNGTWVKFS